MLDAVVAFLVLSLVAAGVVVIIGPRNVTRRLASLRRTQVPSAFRSTSAHDVVPPGLNPKTQRVVVAAARLATWMRTHGQEDASREIRGAAARLPGNEPAGLYALQTALRRIRVVNVTERTSQERLKALVAELRTAVEDRFEQLELLPYRRP